MKESVNKVSSLVCRESIGLPVEGEFAVTYAVGCREQYRKPVAQARRGSPLRGLHQQLSATNFERIQIAARFGRYTSLKVAFRVAWVGIFQNGNVPPCFGVAFDYCAEDLWVHFLVERGCLVFHLRARL